MDALQIHVAILFLFYMGLTSESQRAGGRSGCAEIESTMAAEMEIPWAVVPPPDLVANDKTNLNERGVLIESPRRGTQSCVSALAAKCGCFFNLGTQFSSSVQPATTRSCNGKQR